MRLLQTHRRLMNYVHGRIAVNERGRGEYFQLIGIADVDEPGATGRASNPVIELGFCQY